ncbi:hypothetical protein CIP107546_02322 [Corynebacterium diphtheriae]|nr:hypothetical protein CDIPH_10000 [Corynebacterium diphtheriae]CAB0525801.1 hypothetical protein CIP107506_02084 [Corynebacterium diphtheriae]CAB0618898.1 hypothetical protein CIP107542_02071 [Corynebacterium diphtheriae]CAB0624215.1 hypothetical protein CIP107546_02322 [Corynebacterium diphtheriae]CAB0821137.1 hypothetical protein FRC0263_02361 [Corynebacterium diphtheriae]
MLRRARSCVDDGYHRVRARLSARKGDETYVIAPWFWVPEDNLKLRVARDHVTYEL